MAKGAGGRSGKAAPPAPQAKAPRSPGKTAASLKAARLAAMAATVPPQPDPARGDPAAVSRPLQDGGPAVVPQPVAVTPVVRVDAAVRVKPVKVNPATGGEPPLVAPPPAAPPVPVDDAAAREVQYCLETLDGRLANDPVLRDEIGPFRLAQWTVEARGQIYAVAGRRWCRVIVGADARVELGSTQFPGSKRIPL
jgi:hypothetical protein